jgi:putative transcriptional regulator
MTPTSHPSPETLVAYSAGTLRAGFDFVVAAHLRGCEACRRVVAELDSVGGAALGETRPEDLPHDALARTLARLDEETPPVRPQSIDELLASAKRRWVAPGVWVAKVSTPHTPTDRVYMLGAAPGAATARHGHSGLEFTQVLTGVLVDDGKVFVAGDFAENDENAIHQPGSVGEQECVCLFATSGRLRAAGLIGRIAFAIADV